MILYILISITFLQGINLPYDFDFNKLSNYRSSSNGLSSNTIVDFERYADQSIFMGTTNGLNFGYYDFDLAYHFENFLNTDNMIEGSNSSLIVKDDIIAVAGVEIAETSAGDFPGGTGVSYSLDAGESWYYMPQSKDNLYQDINQWGCPWSDSNELYNSETECDNNCFNCIEGDGQCVMYNYISWGEQNDIRNFSVTVDVQNITYDLAIHGDYIYAASWAGSLRRFNYMIDNPTWEVVPLPMDNQSNLDCNFISSSYQINPIGNTVTNDDGVKLCGYEFDNHKVFSVSSIKDTLWVGTAAGINKGVVQDDDCINWQRLDADEYRFYDDWVIGFEHQVFDDETDRIWAITWDRRYDGSYEIYGGPPSYTDDGGKTWNIAYALLDREPFITYNISPYADRVYVSSNQGLFASYDGFLWEHIMQLQTQNEAVLDAEFINELNHLWVSSQDNIDIVDLNSNENYIASSIGDINLDFYAYPNPIIGDQLIKFVYNGEEQNLNGVITIYDFSLDKVIEIESSGWTTWDGKNEYGKKVANGVYICKYTHINNNTYSFNIMVINK